MSLRRTAAALAVPAALCVAAAGVPAAAADESPSASAPAQPDPPAALYGKGDPQYDGVWRQSVALLAQDTAGVKPAAKAVEWLAGQQCEDGSFASYRPDPAEPCTAGTTADTNATAVAVQALAALGGHEERVTRAVEWLRLVQNDDGGWGYNPGGASDANSVSVVIGALVAADEDPAKVLSAGERNSPYDALLGFRLGCEEAEPDERGAFAFQPEDGRLYANDDATAAAVLAALGGDLTVEPDGDGSGAGAEPPDCGADGADGTPTPAEAAAGGAAYLERVLTRNGGHLLSAMPGAEEQPDYGNTADAVLALAAAGRHDTAEKSLAWLAENAPRWDKFGDSPAALGQLVLAAHATGGDPRDFGGTDLVELLNATGPAPAEDGAAEGGGKDDGKGTRGDGGDGDGSGVPVAAAAGFAVLVAVVALLVSARNRRRSK
ncbi:prenyltransferase/squalene oxidase repeat-containing protein [Streptomyces sp. TRM 70361]|uniref:prenyltransferase/squalene oxidase repeat-containing protein n=1 Tax=Streptomyces sp. TRM 70361 TaxID=3116553 RepID=UPI002E7B49BE|nr:prenyltransferase/squalene oxidase repeat-containing protein [Streptomyces sp. TRM 70361]MEE1939828.1 prenyltransferase/squalene oxidase repeat-containing protein [Streptomyces sp. TRM 70361]